MYKLFDLAIKFLRIYSTAIFTVRGKDLRKNIFIAASFVIAKC